ncbi:MAG: ammonium transporter [Actinobacteria bacterium]|nr:ammonium transporter [Actinomycetota bacterium]
MKKALVGLVLIFLLSVLLIPTVALAGDPSGAQTGATADITAVKPGEPTPQEITDQIGKNRIGINFVWTLITGYIVFFMQAGFALVETGFTRAKNAAHTIAMNLMVFLVGAIGFYLVGFGLMFGGIGGVSTLGGTAPLNGALSVNGWNLLGTRGFLLSSGGAYDVGVFALFLFQMVFMDTAVTIPTGAMAERVKFSAVIIGSFFISMILYPIFGNWVWGGGWLSQIGAKLGLGHGAVDFAGSGVIHMIGGLAGLAGAIVLGPRIGKYGKDGKPVTIGGHHIPMAVLGTVFLFFGWFGFNPGSTLAGTDLRISVIAVNTMMAGAVGGFIGILYAWARTGKPDPGTMCNGALGGLVAITAPSAFVNSISAVIIGAIGGLIAPAAAELLEKKFRVDDPVGAVAVHAFAGFWGLIALGLFADGSYGAGLNGVGATDYLGAPGQGVTGLFYGDASQLIAQLIFAGVAIVWGFGLSFAFYKVLDQIMGIRVSAADELAGLDLPEMGVLAYPEFATPAPVASGSTPAGPASRGELAPGALIAGAEGD